MCKFVDIFVAEIGHFGLLYSTYFRPCQIGKSWVATPSQARNDMKTLPTKCPEKRNKPSLSASSRSNQTKLALCRFSSFCIKKRPLFRVFFIWGGRIVLFAGIKRDCGCLFHKLRLFTNKPSLSASSRSNQTKLALCRFSSFCIKKDPFSESFLSGAEGFEPPRWLDQNQLPYHLATPQYVSATSFILVRSIFIVKIFYFPYFQIR